MRIYHNPRCSKSRATLAMLQERDKSVEIIDYQQTPPSAEELDNILRLLDMTPRQLMRHGEDDYAQLNLDDSALSREQLIAAMIAHPKLIQRPIVLANGKAAIGRPPEAVLDIL